MEIPTKIFGSKKATIGAGGVGAILTLVQFFGLSSTVAGYIIGGIIALNIIMQGLIDLKKEQK